MGGGYEVLAEGPSLPGGRAVLLPARASYLLRPFKAPPPPSAQELGGQILWAPLSLLSRRPGLFLLLETWH